MTFRRIVIFALSIIVGLFTFIVGNLLFMRFPYHTSSHLLGLGAQLMASVVVLACLHPGFPLWELCRMHPKYWYQKAICYAFFKIMSIWNPPNQSLLYLLVFCAVSIDCVCFIEVVGPGTFGILDSALSSVWTYGSSKNELLWKFTCYIFVIGVKTLRYYRDRPPENKEVHHLREDLNELKRKYDLILDQVYAVGLNPDLLGSSVKELQDTNLYLKELFQWERRSRLARLESDMSAELKRVQRNLKTVEDSCKSLLMEKATLTAEKARLMYQLRVTNEKLEIITDEKGTLISKIAITQGSLKHLEIRYTDSVEKCRLEIQNLSSSLEDAHIEAAMRLSFMEDIYGVILREAINEAGLYERNLVESLEDWKKNFVELSDRYFLADQDRDSLQMKVMEKEDRLRSEVEEKKILRQELTLLSKTLEDKERLLMKVSKGRELNLLAGGTSRNAEVERVEDAVNRKPHPEAPPST